jgi:ribosome-associated toxin RatA of RatAB toxin-antitoxin module
MPLIRYEQDHPIPKTLLREVILDFDAYSDFIPQVRSSSVKKAGKGAWEVEINLFVIRPLSYRIRMEEIEDGHLVWDLLEGVFTINRGYWKLEESELGCLVAYEVELQLGTFLPSLITRKLQERSIPDLILAFVREANKRLGVQQGNDQADN